MDYSKRGIERKQKSIRSIGRRAEKKFSYTIFRLVVIAVLLVIVLGVSAAVGGVKGVIDSSPELNIDDIAPDAFKSYMYLEDGTELLELADTGANRIEVDISQISESVKSAFIALEDERFWEHNGIDPQGIGRAFFVGIKNVLAGGEFTEGASTITQQLLKNAIFSGGNESSMLLKFKRKFQEQYLAVQLEKQLPKDKILQAYLNTINLGETCYGVEAAAQMYFNKHASELGVAESSVLAAIAQSPNYYNPYINPENNKKRRKICLDDLLEQGYIDQAEYDAAINDDIYTSIKENTENYKNSNYKVTTYYEDAAIKMLIDDFIELYGYADDPTTVGYDEAEEQAKHKLYSGGYSVYLAQDPHIQQICDDYYADNNNFPTLEYLLNWALTVYNDDGTTTNYSVNMLEERLKEYYGNYNLLYSGSNIEERAQADIALYMELEGIPDKETNYSWMTLTPQIQSSFVLMDHTTGLVKAIVGGRGTKTVSRSFNRATDATRSPGSTFKIVSTYAPALEEFGKTLASTEVDSIYTAYGGHQVHNVDNSYTNAPMTYRDAIIRSKNTVAVRVLASLVTPQYSLNFLRDRFHFTTLVDTDAVEVMAIGGLTDGVTNLELTAAYASIANGGIYCKPVLYTRVLDHEGNVVIDNTVPETSVALKPSTAYLLTDAMQAVVTAPYGTGRNAFLSTMPVAGKTGSSEERRDHWFLGFTPYYTAGIWFGYDDNTPIRDRVGQWGWTAQQTLWKNIMTAVHEGFERKEFEVPDGVEKVYICSQTGLLATTTCPAVSTYVDVNSAPTEYCTGHYVPPESESDESEETDPNTPPAQDPNTPPAQDPNTPPAQDPNTPPAQEPTPTPQPTPTPEPTPAG